MVFTYEDEDQIMLDLYEGLDTFSRKADENDKPQDYLSNSITIQTSAKDILEKNQGGNEEGTAGADSDYQDALGFDDQVDDNDDGLVFLVEEKDDEYASADTAAKEVRHTAKRRPGGWTARYKKKERVVYIGAPSSESHAMASTEPKKECFCLVSGIPWWMDVQEFGHLMETLGGAVAFSKILSDPMNGQSLGVGLVEFVDGRTGALFCKAKSQFIAKALSDDLFDVIKQSPLYREGVFKVEMLNRVAAHLGISLRINFAARGVSDHFHEIEFEVRQQEMIQNGDFEIVSRIFPWLNMNVLKLMGYAKRNERSNMDNTYDIDNHLEAYKRTKNVNQNYLNMMMPQFIMANYMQHATTEIGETGIINFPFNARATSKHEKPFMRQKINRDVKKGRNDEKNVTREKERSRSTTRRKERNRRRVSESPNTKRHRHSSRTSNDSILPHRDNGHRRD